MQTAQFNVRLPLDLKARLAKFTAATGLTPSSVTREALLLYLNAREEALLHPRKPSRPFKAAPQDIQPAKTPARRPRTP